MNEYGNLVLRYGDLLVGTLTSVFCSDATWYGALARTIESDDGGSASRILKYIEFCEEWNERVRSGAPADPAEFDSFADIVSSGLWSTETTIGERRPILDAPAFFAGDEVSWRDSINLSPTVIPQPIPTTRSSETL